MGKSVDVEKRVHYLSTPALPALMSQDSLVYSAIVFSQ